MISNNIFTSDIISGHYFHADGNVDVDGNLKVDGDFTVNGTTSTVNSVTLTVDDKNIELGSVDAPTDITADGGGLTLKGDTDKTITWLASNNSWNYNQNLVVPQLSVESSTPIFKLVDTNDGPDSVGWVEFNRQEGRMGFIGYGSQDNDDLYFQNDMVSGDIRFQTETNPSAIRVKHDGRIGIGTSSPLARVQIETNDGSTIYDPSDTKPPELGDYLLSLRNTYAGGNVAGTLAGIQFNIDGDGVGNTNSVGSINLVIEEDNLQKASLCFSPDPGDATRKEAMRISSDGYVGVGTTDPVAPMHIKRDSQGGEANALVLQNNFANDSGESVNLSFKGSADHDLASIDALVTATDAGGKYPADLIFKTSAAGQDKAEKLRIVSNGNVGIGTASPAQLLHVNSSPDANSARIRIENGEGHVDIGTDGTDGFLTAGGTEVFRFDSAGNVGIGTTAPNYSLDVHTINGGGIGVKGADDTNNGWRLKPLGNDLQIVQSLIPNAERLTIQDGGNVGIGTTSPSAKLHIPQGSSTIGGNDLSNASILLGSITTGIGIDDNEIIKKHGTNGGQLNIGSQGVDAAIKFKTGANENGLPYDRMFIDSDGNVGIGTTAPASRLHVTGGQAAFFNNDPGIAPLYSLQEGTGPSAYFMGGNVGIGTTSPDHKLHVDGGDIKISSDSNTSNGDGLPSLLFCETTNTGNEACIVFNGDLETGEDNYLGFGVYDITNPLEDTLAEKKLRTSLHIRRNGNIGIGTTSPDHKLHIAGGTPAMKLEGTQPRIWLSETDETDLNTLIRSIEGEFRIDTASDQDSFVANRLTINHTSGNVGIGTTNPSADLHVIGQGYFNRSSDTSAPLYAKQDGLGPSAYFMGGNVGIETTTPESELHIVGKTTIQSSGPVLVLKDSDGGDSNSQVGFIDYRDQNDVQRGYVGFDSHGTKEFTIWNMIGDIRLGTGTTVNMRIKENGTVEIPGDLVVTGTTTTNNVETVSTSNGVVFEGSATDDNEGLLKADTLTADRTYTLPNASGTVALTNNISNSTVTITAGGALTGGGSVTLNGSGGTITLNHQDTSSQGSSNNSGRTYIQDIGLDAYGHVTSIGTATETVVNTDTTYTAGSGLDLSGNTFSVESNLIGEVEWIGSSTSYVRYSDAMTLPTTFGSINVPPQISFYVDSNQATNDGTRVVFQSDGDVHVEADVVAFSSIFSDKKLKDNIGQIKGGLEKVKKLRGVEFDWNATSRKGTKDIGVIAQEVEEVVPEVVTEKVPCVGEFCENTEKYKTVDYSKLVPVLIEAIKDLSEEVEELKKKLS